MYVHFYMQTYISKLKIIFFKSVLMTVGFLRASFTRLHHRLLEKKPIHELVAIELDQTRWHKVISGREMTPDELFITSVCAPKTPTPDGYIDVMTLYSFMETSAFTRLFDEKRRKRLQADVARIVAERRSRFMN